MPKTINLAKDYSPYPAGRYRTDGRFSGELFREKFLAPALRENDTVIVVLDGVAGLPSSFAEEAFGGLVREDGFSVRELERKLSVVTHTPRLERYPETIWAYIRDAALTRSGV